MIGCDWVIGAVMRGLLEPQASLEESVNNPSEGGMEHAALTAVFRWCTGL